MSDNDKDTFDFNTCLGCGIDRKDIRRLALTEVAWAGEYYDGGSLALPLCTRCVKDKTKLAGAVIKAINWCTAVNDPLRPTTDALAARFLELYGAAVQDEAVAEIDVKGVGLADHIDMVVGEHDSRLEALEGKVFGGRTHRTGHATSLRTRIFAGVLLAMAVVGSCAMDNPTTALRGLFSKALGLLDQAEGVGKEGD